MPLRGMREPIQQGLKFHPHVEAKLNDTDNVYFREFIARSPLLMKNTILVLSAAIALAACGNRKEVVLRSENGKIELRYECSNVQPKAKTTVEGMVLLANAARVADELRSNGDAVSAYEMAVLASRELRALERALVKYECEKNAK